MPSCSVKNCMNRVRTKNIKFFQFPKEPVLLQQWLKACGKNGIPKSATVCSIHFDEDCFQMVWTKPRRENIPAKQMWRLKKNSIPTKLLNVEKKRKARENDNKRVKTTHTGVPTYEELVQYAREKQHIHSEQTACVIDTNIYEDERVLLSDVAVKETINEEIDSKKNVVEMLLELLKKSEEEKNKLLTENTKLIEENENLIHKNEKLNLQLVILEKSMQQESNIAQMETNKLKETEK